MDDWKQQLSSRFGGVVPEPEPQPAPPPGHGGAEFDADSHLVSPWLQRLRGLEGRAGGKALGRSPKLAAARQRHAAVVKALKKAGQQREVRSLDKLRNQYLAKRTGQAWAVVKARFSEAELSEKAYRSIKQGGADPEKVLQRIDAMGTSALVGMGAKRLRQALLG